MSRTGNVAALSIWLYWGICLGQTVGTVTEPINASGGIAVDSSDRIYIADFGALLNRADGTQVLRIDPAGSVTVFAQGLAGASGNCFDSKGNLLQSNIAGNRISRISPEGAVKTLADQGIGGPVGIAVGADDTVYVANCGTGSIAKIASDGTVARLTASKLLQCPNGLTIDSAGNLYAANFRNGWVVKVTSSGRASNLAQIPGKGNGHLTYANGLLYVVGRNANQIFQVTLQGEVRRIAGAGREGAGPRGNQDGPALDATFSIPNGIRASLDGDTLYVNSAVPTVGAELNPVVVRAIRGVRKLLPSND